MNMTSESSKMNLEKAAMPSLEDALPSTSTKGPMTRAQQKAERLDNLTRSSQKLMDEFKHRQDFLDQTIKDGSVKVDELVSHKLFVESNFERWRELQRRIHEETDDDQRRAAIIMEQERQITNVQYALSFIQEQINAIDPPKRDEDLGNKIGFPEKDLEQYSGISSISKGTRVSHKSCSSTLSQEDRYKARKDRLRLENQLNQVEEDRQRIKRELDVIRKLESRNGDFRKPDRSRVQNSTEKEDNHQGTTNTSLINNITNDAFRNNF